MRLCRPALLALLLAGAVLLAPAQQTTPPASAPVPAPSLTVDRDPVRSPDGEPPAPPVLRKEGEGYVLHTDVEEVALNCTVLDDHNRLVPGLKKEEFQVLEDGDRSLRGQLQ